MEGAVARSMTSAGDKGEGMLRLQMVPLFLCSARLICTFNFVPVAPLLPKKLQQRALAVESLFARCIPPGQAKFMIWASRLDLHIRQHARSMRVRTLDPFFISASSFGLICQSILPMNWIHENEF
jgi:hypothetical protein